MKLPPTPPEIDAQGIEKILKSLLTDSVQRYIAEANAEYYHWEDLRYRLTPENMTPREAWSAVKLSRASLRRPLPLRDERGRPFGYGLPPSAMEVLHEVDRWGGTTLAVAEGFAPTLGAMQDRVIISSLMEEAIATSQIEGAVTTRKVAKEMLRANRKPRNRSEQMIVNSYRTIQMLRQRLDRPLSADLLLEIQQSMTRDALDDPTAAGRFRTTQENVSVIDVQENEVVFTPPPADQLPQRVAKLVDFANAPADKENFIHPLVKAAILHFWLAYEHPFVDGNGRTARALFYWYMLKRGYWLFEFLTISRVIHAAPVKYYRSFLHSENDGNDATYSILYQLRATQRALAGLRAYLADKQEEQRLFASALRRLTDLNYRQRALLEHALTHPTQGYTFQSHQNSHGITYVTARKDLIDLAERGLLTERKQGNQRAFLPAPDLAEKLTDGGKRQKGRKRS